ncbi:MAG: hypothetical protein ACFCUW_12270 [Kiloniellaceae bacterium]
MTLAAEIDSAARRGPAAPAAGDVTPELVRLYDRRARDLRAEAQAAVLRRLFAAPCAGLERLLAWRRRPERTAP